MSERVVILGGGESGTGAALLAKVKGFDVFVSDQSELKEKYRNELLKEAIAFEEGKHTLDKIVNANLIIKSPGIPDKAEVIKKARAANIEIIDEIEFAFRYLTGKVIAITGTNGKTTTTLLTYHLMKSAGYNVALAGNVGESLARKVAQMKHDWYVLEVSSFQLDGTTSFKPHIGVLLNITPDHLDRYEYKMENYIDSKFRLIQKMNAEDYFIYYADDSVLKNEVSKRNLAQTKIKVSLTDKTSSVHFDGEKMSFNLDNTIFSIAQSETTLKGPHNLINTMSAVAAVFFAGADIGSIREGLKTFKNAPHRLESVGIINGVEFINDSKATNVDSVVYALGSYNQPLVWIAGGIDKGNDYNIIKDEVQKKVKTLICLGKDNEKLKKFFGGIVKEIRETQTIKELVRMALQSAKQGDVVLLSPACASFDLFKNYEDRGNQFREAVVELKKETELKTEYRIQNVEYSMERVSSKSFKDLIVWQKAHRLVLDIYLETKNFPKEELYGLTSQIRRSSSSVAANIAEAFKKKSPLDKLRILNIAQGSLSETEYHILLAKDLNYTKLIQLQSKAEEVSRLLESYMKAIRN